MHSIDMFVAQDESDDPVRLQLQALNYGHGDTGGGGSNRASPRKLATKLPGLVPINIDKSFEFYLGIRNPQTQKYTGDRLFYDKSTTELEPCPGQAPHETN